MTEKRLNQYAAFYRWSLELSRWTIGILFVFSGFVKAIDPMGSALKMADYLTSWGLFLPVEVGWTASVLLILAEFFTGYFLLIRVRMKIASGMALIFLSAFTPLTFYVALFNPVSDCGCFGDALKISNWETFFKNLIFLPLSIWLWMQMRKIDGHQKFNWRSLLLVVWGAFIVGGPMVWALRNEPAIDFRPFSLGTHIPQAMQVPEGVPLPEYETTFVMEKAGVRKEFTMDNYPYTDSTWVFVDSKTKVIREGFQPAIKDFSLLDEHGAIVTERLLSHPSPVILVVMPRLPDQPQPVVVKLNELMLFAARHEWPAFVVTASLKNEVNKWMAMSPPYFNWLWADETLLKTVVRSNPGILILHQGVVVGKYTLHTLPPVSELSAPSGLVIGELKQKNIQWMVFSLIFVTFFLAFTLNSKSSTIKSK